MPDAGQSAQGEITTVYVGDLHPETSETSLDQLLKEAVFEVRSLKVVLDRETNKSKGYAYVNFPSKEAAEKAIRTLLYKDLNGR